MQSVCLYVYVWGLESVAIFGACSVDFRWYLVRIMSEVLGGLIIASMGYKELTSNH